MEGFVTLEWTYFFATATKAFNYWPSKLEREGVCWCGGTGDRVARPVWAAFCHDLLEILRFDSLAGNANLVRNRDVEFVFYVVRLTELQMFHRMSEGELVGLCFVSATTTRVDYHSHASLTVSLKEHST